MIHRTLFPRCRRIGLGALGYSKFANSALNRHRSASIAKTAPDDAGCPDLQGRTTASMDVHGLIEFVWRPVAVCALR